VKTDRKINGDEVLMEIKRVKLDSDDYLQELELRYRLLREPLGMTREQVCSPIEMECEHFIILDAGQICGCVLLHIDSPTTGRLLQMAVDSSQQGKGLGARLVSALESYAAKQGISNIHLHSREAAKGFYGRLGYVCYGEPFVEVGIAHIAMSKEIS